MCKADEGGAGVDIFKTTVSPDEVSPLIQKELQEFTEYQEKHLSQYCERSSVDRDKASEI